MFFVGQYAFVMLFINVWCVWIHESETPKIHFRP